MGSGIVDLTRRDEGIDAGGGACSTTLHSGAIPLRVGWMVGPGFGPVDPEVAEMSVQRPKP